MKKRFLSILLALVMLLSLLPTTAFAKGGGHTHTDAAEAEKEIKFSAWGDEDGETTSLPAAANLTDNVGSFYLTNNVTLSDKWTVPTGTVNLCLNGYTVTWGTITTPGATGGIEVGDGATLNIYDCKDTEHYGHIDATFHVWAADETAGDKNVSIFGGSIRNGAQDMGQYGIFPYTANIHIAVGGAMSINGGNIVGFNSGYGGIKNEGTLLLNDGCILGNTGTTQGNGGGIHNVGKLEMSGGKIAYNYSPNGGGGVYNNINSQLTPDSYFKLKGGTVSDNSAYMGGGIFSTTDAAGKPFELLGGTVEGNHAVKVSGKGGVGGGICSMGNIVIGGGTVQNNTDEYDGGGTADFAAQSSTTVSPNSPGMIRISENGLAAGTRIVLTPQQFAVEKNTITNAKKSDLQYFAAPEGYRVRYMDKTKEIGMIAVPKGNYLVNIDASDCGDLTAPDYALPNATVTVTVEPEPGHQLKKLTYTPEGGVTTEIKADDTGVYSFTMPSTDVTLAAEFEVDYLPCTHGVGDSHDAAWTGTTTLPATAGKYYLTDNVTLTEPWSAPEGTTDLCLNGFTITWDSNIMSKDVYKTIVSPLSPDKARKTCIVIPDGATLIICDCDDTEHYGHIASIEGMTPTDTDYAKMSQLQNLWIEDEAPTDKNISIRGGSIRGGFLVQEIPSYPTMYMTIPGSFTVQSGGKLAMHGGNIVGCKMGDGGLILDYGSFTMTDGMILGNSSPDQYGKSVVAVGNETGVSTDGFFRLAGGRIAYNHLGNAVTVSAIVENIYDATYQNIIGKTNYKWGGNFEISGGTIDHNITGVHLQGGMVIGGGRITDNISTGQMVADVVSEGSTGMRIAKTGLAEGTRIGLSILNVRITNAEESDKQHFFSGSPYLYVAYDKDKRELFMEQIPAGSNKISVQCSEGGTVTVDEVATATAPVTFTVTVDKGYQLKSLVVSSGGNPVEYDDNKNGTYTFTMPQAAVTIEAEFEYNPSHTHDDLTFQPWESNNSLPAAANLNDGAGSFYLTDDVTLSSTWNVPSGTVNLCLNGHVIKANSSDFGVITIGGGAALNLYDCDKTEHFGHIDTTTHLWTADTEKQASGNVSVFGGYITGGMGGVQVLNGGHFTMNGGTICGNKASECSGGVSILSLSAQSSFTMSGGSICGNAAGENGGGVLVMTDTEATCQKSSFTMSGGSICNNYAGFNGGGVSLWDGAFTMSGGNICSNNAGINGDGVYAGGTFTMTGGEISKNDGSGAYIPNSDIVAMTMTMTGGEIRENTGFGVSNEGGTFRVGGTALVRDNKYYSSAGDVNTGGIVIAETAPADGMLVGVMNYAGNKPEIAASTVDYSKYFFSNHDNMYVAFENNTLVLKPLNTRKKITTTPSENALYYVPQAAEPNSTVTMSFMPDGGYEVESVSYKPDGGAAVTLEANVDGTYSFTMPNVPVTVTPVIVLSGPSIKVTKAKSAGGEEVANPVYNTAENARQLFTVTAKNFTPDTSKFVLQWADDQGGWTGSAPSGVELTTAGLVTTSATTPAGSYAFRITNGEAEYSDAPTNTVPNPDFASGTGTLTIDKAAGTASVSMTGWTYGGTANNPVPTSSTNGTSNVAYQYKLSVMPDATYANDKPTDAGTYTVKATFAATDNYTEVTATANFTINKATPTITAWPTLPATITYGDFTTFGDITLTGGTAANSLAGDFYWAETYRDIEATVTNSQTTTNPFMFVPEDGNYDVVTGGGSVAVTINAADYPEDYSSATNAVASGDLKAKNGERAEIALPEIPAGASYGAVTNNYTGYFTVGTIDENTGEVTVTSAKDWVKATDGEDAKTFTVTVTADENHNNYYITVSVAPVYKTEVSFAEDAVPVNGGNKITFSDSGTSYDVTAPTVSVGGNALDPQPTMTYTYYQNTGSDGTPVWTPLNPNEKPTNAGSYKVVIAVSDNDPAYAGSKEYTFSIAKADVEAPALADGVNINYANEKIAPKDGYEVSTTSGDDFDTGKLTGETVIDFTKTYYVRKAEDANHKASAEETFVPARPTTPGTPELVSKTNTTVIVTAVEGQEYSIDNGANWVAGTNGKVTFSGLTQNTAYSVITRVKAVTTSGSESFASESNTALSVTTKTSPAAAPIGVTASVTATSVILPASGKPNTYEYSADGTNWQDSNAFTGLDSAKQYTYYVRVKETGTAMPSQAATVTAYTNQSAPKKGDGYTISSYDNDGKPIITITSGYEVSISPDFGTTISNGTALTVGETYYVRKAASGSIGASAGTAFVAIEQPKVTVSATSSNSSGGSVTVEGVTNGVCFVGTSVTLTATPNAGYKFVGWYDGETQKSTATPYTFDANEATLLTAKFVVDQEKVETSPVSAADAYGSAKTLETLKGGHHYTLTSDPALTGNAGTYKLTAKLDEGYVWEDGTTADKTFFYTVTKQTTDALPENVSANTSGNGITGVTSGMEWRKSTDSAYQTGTGAEIPNLDYGTYYVRVKGDVNHEAGKDVVVVLRSPVTTNAPTDITANTAKLNGTSTDGISTVTYQYRKVGNDAWVDSATADLTGLTADTEYEYRAVVNSAAGEIMTFRTEKQNPPTGSIQVHIKGTGSTNVTVTVEQGNTIISTKTGSIASGTMNASFTNLADGYYNLVVSTNDYTETRLLEVKNGAATQAKFDIPTGTLSSVVEVKKDAPKVAVGGLADLISEEEADAAAAGSKSVEVKLEVEKRDENADGNEQIKVLAGNQVVDTFLDMSLFKTTTEANGDNKTTTRENIGSEDSNPVLEIVIPFNTNRNGLQIYRYHDGVAKKLAKLSERPTGNFTDGTYYIGDGYLFVYTKQFSIYAIGYEEEQSEYHGGGSDSSYAVELSTNVKNGKVEVTPKNASAGSTVTITVTPDKGFTLETLTVLDKNGKEVEVKNLGNNKYSFKMPSSKVTISATFMEDNSMLNFFVDVDATKYYYDAVLWAAENNITKGTDAVHFSPNLGVTRAQVVTFLWRASGCPEPTGNASKFTDVVIGSYYEKAVAWAIEQGITKGTSDTTFSPDKVCTRGQIVTFLARFAGVKDEDKGYTHGFTDVKATDYYNNAVAWAKDNKVTEGTTPTTFSPNTDCTRAQVVTFLYRWMVK